MRGNISPEAVALSFIEAQDVGDLQELDRLLTPDARWWILSRGEFDRAGFLALAARRHPPGSGRRSAVIGIASEDDRVAVEFETETMVDGVSSFRVFHNLFQVRDGRIVSGREYLDPAPSADFPTSQAVAPGELPADPVAATDELSDQTRAVTMRFLGPGPERLSQELLAPGMRWWVGGVGFRDFVSYFSNMAEKMADLEVPVAFRQEILSTTVEGDRAAVQIVTDVTWTEFDYRNEYLCVVIVRDGKVAEFREHTDRHAAARAGIHAPE
jgi:ketosteroid isomerase-like protein